MPSSYSLIAGDERWIQDPLLDILSTLADIPIICLHHEMWSFNLHRTRLIDSAKAGKLSFFTLGEHVRTLVKVENTELWTQEAEDGDFRWNDVPIEVFVPVSLPRNEREHTNRFNIPVADLPASGFRCTTVANAREDRSQ
jgi:hypothetical protein